MLQGDTFHYIIDGKVHVAYRGLLDTDVQMAKAYWDGGTLVIETSQEIGPGGTRLGESLQTIGRWKYPCNHRSLLSIEVRWLA